jgi:ACR3 family arsenite transporter
MSELSLEEIALPKFNIQASPISPDIEAQSSEKGPEASTSIAEKESIFKSLGWLDRFLALWIFLAMAIGIILGNFVPNTGPALQKGKFVGVSVPIGMFLLF